MEELVAKRYIKALSETMDKSSMQNMCDLFETLSKEFKNDAFMKIMNNPQIDSSKKEKILLDAVKSVNSVKINNFISLLVEKKRVGIIPAISTELKKNIARENRSYSGTVYSNNDLNSDALKSLSNGLGKKVDANIALEFIKSDFDGIKVEVEDLGIEINFSKSRLTSQLVDHILKAI
jgi:F-type H+-transporting ATPase subunit delta